MPEPLCAYPARPPSQPAVSISALIADGLWEGLEFKEGGVRKAHTAIIPAAADFLVGLP